jgi:PAS domain S-box-containing protein
MINGAAAEAKSAVDPGRLALLIGGVVAVLLTGTVIAGWLLHEPDLIALSPGFSTMRFNTALGLFMLGGAEISLYGGRPTIARIATVLAMLLGVLTLAEYLFSSNFGIDQLLMHDFTGEPAGMPGRMARGTALSLVLSGAALTLMYGKTARIAAAAILYSVILSLSMAVLLFYLLGIDYAHQPMAFTGMAMHTAALFALLACCALAGRSRMLLDTAARWAPIACALGAIALTLALWYGARLQDRNRLQDTISDSAISTRVTIEQALTDRKNALRRMADRWRTDNGTPRVEWEADAAAYLRDWPDTIQMDRIDAPAATVWRMPPEYPGFGTVPSSSACAPFGHGEHAFALNHAASRRNDFAVISLRQPLLANDVADGYLCVDFRLQQFLQSLTRPIFDPEDYQVLVEDGSSAILVSGADADADSPVGKATIDYDGLVLQISLRASTALLRTQSSPMPQAVLTAGLLLTALLTLATRLLFTSTRQQRALLASESRYQNLLESLHYGAFVVQDDRFVLVNAALPKMFGYGRAEFSVLKLHDLLDADSRKRLKLDLPDWRTPLSETLAPFELCCVTKNGTPLWVSVSLQPTLYRERYGLLGIVQDIGDRKAGEEREQLYRQRLELVARGSIDGLWDWDLQNNVNYYSERFHALLGYEPGELQPVLETFNLLLHPDDRDRTYACITRSLEHHQPYALDYRLRTKSGDYRWFHVRGQGLWDANDKPVRLAGSIEDITEHRKRAAALEAAHALQSAILSSANLSIIATDSAGMIILFNAAAERMLGYGADEMVGLRTPELIHDPEEVAARAATLGVELGRTMPPGFEVFVAKSRLGIAEEREWTYIRKDGSRLPVLLSVTAIRDTVNNITGFLGIAIDITERKKHEAEIQRLLSIIEECPDFIGMGDMKGNLLYHNRAARRMVGLPDYADISRMKIADMHPDWASTRVITVGVPAVMQHGTWQSDNALLHRDGHEIPVSQLLMLHRDTQGRPEFLSTIMRDISDRLRADEARARLAGIVESSDDAIVGVATDGLILSWNAGARQMFGYDAAEIVCQSVTRLHPPQRATEVTQLLSRIRTERHIRLDDSVGVRKDGSQLFMSLAISPVRDAGGRVTGASWIARDITERHQQAARVEASLKEKEMLLKEVYHRVKNNLQVIQSMIRLQTRTLTDPIAQQALEDTVRRVRAMGLVHEKLYQSGNLAAVSLPEFVRDLFRQLNETTGANARRVQLLAEIDAFDVGLDVAVPLGLLMTELVSNSLKHGFPGGREGEVRVTLKRDGADAVLGVSDNGVGLPPDFDLEKAASMGLTLAATLARQLRGRLETPALPQADFRVRIPGIHVHSGERLAS